MTRPVVVQRTIDASPVTVFSFFTDRDRWLSWQGVEARIDPRPGGIFRLNGYDGTVFAGKFVTVEPYRRISFTWGYENGAIPPGSSTVDITFQSTGPTGTGTVLRLTHIGLPPDLFDDHVEGWRHYLDRLVIRAEGGFPGPDIR